MTQPEQIYLLPAAKRLLIASFPATSDEEDR